MTPPHADRTYYPADAVATVLRLLLRSPCARLDPERRALIEKAVAAIEAGDTATWRALVEQAPPLKQPRPGR